MEAVPLAAVVEGPDEERLPLESLEHALTARAARDRIAERAAEPVQHGDLDQEVRDLGGLQGEDLTAQVVSDMAVVAGEVGNELVRVGVVPQAQGGEVHTRGPTLGPTVQGLHLDRVQDPAGDPPERLPRLVDGQRQGALADLHHLVTEAEPRGPGQSVVPADEDEPDAVGRPLGQQAELVEHDRADEGLEVLDDDRHRSDVGQLGEHHVEQVLAEGHAVGTDVVHRPAAGAGHELFEALDQATTELDGVVGRTGRHPQDPLLGVGVVPLGQQDGLAVPRGGHDQHHALPVADSTRSIRAGRSTTKSGIGAVNRHWPAPSSSCPAHPSLAANHRCGSGSLPQCAADQGRKTRAGRLRRGIDPLQPLDRHAEVTQRPEHPLERGLVLDPAPQAGVGALGAQHLELREGGENPGSRTTGEDQLVWQPLGTGPVWTPIAPAGHPRRMILAGITRVR